MIPSRSTFPPPYLPPTTSLWRSEETPDYIRNTEEFYQHLLGPPDNLNIVQTQIAKHIESNTAAACSDGSYDPQYGTGSH